MYKKSFRRASDLGGDLLAAEGPGQKAFHGLHNAKKRKYVAQLSLGGTRINNSLKFVCLLFFCFLIKLVRYLTSVHSETKQKTLQRFQSADESFTSATNFYTVNSVA